MYETDTILKLREPKSTEDKPFPYDRVRVIGVSPINHGIHGGSWVGSEGQGIIITPLNGFGSTLDEPLGKLQALYEVESLPVHEAPAVPVKVINPTSGGGGPSPEEVFAEEARKNPAKPTRRESRKRQSPLEDPRPTAEEASPLGAGEGSDPEDAGE